MEALLAGLFIELGTSALVSHDSPLPMDRQKVVNPYGTAAIGYEAGNGRVSFAVKAMHTSSIASRRDQGDDALAVTLTWRPFRN